MIRAFRRRIDLACVASISALDLFFGTVIGFAVATHLELEGSQRWQYFTCWEVLVLLRAAIFGASTTGYLRPTIRALGTLRTGGTLSNDGVSRALSAARRAPLLLSLVWAGTYALVSLAIFCALVWLRPFGITPPAEFFAAGLLISSAIVAGAWAICYPLMHWLLWSSTCELANEAQARGLHVATRVISFRVRLAVLAVCLGLAPLNWTLGMGLSVDGRAIRERAVLRAELAATELAANAQTGRDAAALVATPGVFLADGQGRILYGDRSAGTGEQAWLRSAITTSPIGARVFTDEQRAVSFRRVSGDLIAGAIAEIDSPYTTAYLVMGFLSLLVVAAWAPLCGWFISLSAARPIAQIARLTGDISQKGGIDAADRLPEAHGDELGELAAGTNRMLTRLQDSIAQITVKQRLEKEMEIANGLQTSILPRVPKVDGLQIAAVMVPATEVGGDYYDVLPVEGGCWLGIGDVSGHGLTSGLVMLQTQSAVSALVARDPGANPRDVLVGVNKVLYENIRRRLAISEHMTMSLVRYHRDGRLVFAGAHEDIVIWRAATKTCELVPTPGTWLGMGFDIANATVETSCRLLPGDVLVLYTDGVIEAMNARREQFGTERLCEALAGVEDQPVQDICEHLMTKVRAWSDVQFDDITLLVSRYQA